MIYKAIDSSFTITGSKHARLNTREVQRIEGCRWI